MSSRIIDSALSDFELENAYTSIIYFRHQREFIALIRLTNTMLCHSNPNMHKHKMFTIYLDERDCCWTVEGTIIRAIVPI